MIHPSVSASRRIARVIAAAGGPLWVIVAGANPASAGSAAPGVEPPLRGSYCEESEQDLARSQAGCARISGYIAAGARLDSDAPVDGRPNLFAPLDGPGMAAGLSEFKDRAGQSFPPPLGLGAAAH